MTNESPQLPLKLKSHSDKSFDKFITADNATLIHSIKEFTNNQQSIFYLWGVSSSGKTHILQALVNDMKHSVKSIAILPYSDIDNRENLSLISVFNIVCIDNSEHIIADKSLEESLFHWINEIKQANKKIIIASQLSNKNNTWQLPDLVSRLQSGQTHELKRLNRQQAMQVFTSLAKEQGILINKNIHNYLINNASMDMKFLTNLLTQLEEATLVHKKSVTIPLLKKIIAAKSC